MKQQIDIENLVIWTFQTERATLRDVGLDVTAGYPQDCIVRCEQVCVMGGFITGTGPGARVLAQDSADDAVTVVDAMASLPPADARLVAAHGKAGSRPDWRPYAHHRIEPRDWEWDEGSGEPWGRAETCPLPQSETKFEEGRFEYDVHAGRSKRVPKPRWVPVVVRDDPTAVMKYRARYTAWVASLAILLDHLDGRLADWHMSMILPDPAPWKR